MPKTVNRRRTKEIRVTDIFLSRFSSIARRSRVEILWCRQSSCGFCSQMSEKTDTTKRRRSKKTNWLLGGKLNLFSSLNNWINWIGFFFPCSAAILSPSLSPALVNIAFATSSQFQQSVFPSNRYEKSLSTDRLRFFVVVESKIDFSSVHSLFFGRIPVSSSMIFVANSIVAYFSRHIIDTPLMNFLHTCYSF